MATSYTYLFTGPEPYFDNGLDVNQMQAEIEASSISSATFTHIRNIGTAADIWFDGPLSGGDETTLQGLVTAHLPVPVPDPYQPLAVLDKTVNPLPTNDETQNYAIGSRWINVSSDEEFVCLNATTGAAVWKSTSGYENKTTTDPLVTNDVTEGYDQGSRWLNTSTNVEWICLDATTGAAVWREVVIATSVQTLTNKTLTTPKIANGGYIADTNGNELLKFSNVASAVNEITVTNAATGNNPSISATGSDANISITLIPSGTGTVDVSSKRITNLATPTANSDAATKLYVDTAIEGLNIKTSVRAATTVAGTLASDFEAGDVIDGVTLVAGNRILIKDQASQVENGIYVVQASGSPVRASDLLSGSSAAAAFCFVQEGTANADYGWVCINNTGSDIVGTDNLQFTQFNGTGSITAGDGITKTGNTIDVDLKANGGLVIESAQIAVDLGATNITGTLAATDGGTGLSTYTTGDILYASASNTLSKLAAAATGNVLISGTTPSWNKITDSHVDAAAAIDASKIANGTVSNTEFQQLAAIGSAAVGISDTQTLTNKTLTAPIISTIVNTGTLTLPTSTDTLVGRNTTDTLTNKTLTAPKIANAGFIADTNGNELLIFNNIASAVNEVTLTNAVTGTNPSITASGSDTNVSLSITGKGSGVVSIMSVKHYGASATDPATPTPADGDQYYNTTLHHEMRYDGSRSKWLSVATFVESNGRAGNTTAGSYYRKYDGMVLTASTGPFVPKGTVVYIGYTTSTAVSHTYEVIVNGTAVAELASGGGATAISGSINGDFSQGNMAARNKAGSTTSVNLQAVIYYKLRA